MVNAQQVHEGGLKVMHMHRVVGDVDSQVVSRPVADPRFDSPASHPDGVGIRMVITAPPRAIVDVALQERSTPKFTAPDDKRVLK